jgi:hypothetical protein
VCSSLSANLDHIFCNPIWHRYTFLGRLLDSQAGFDLVRVESALHVEHGHGDEGAEHRPVVHLLQIKPLLEAELPGRVLAFGRHQFGVRETTRPAERHRLVQKGSPNTPMTTDNNLVTSNSTF